MRAKLLLFLVTATLAGASPVVLHSGPQRVTLVELFTSEGCSSCPPADRWLAALADDAGLWTRWVPVGEHVDYWDRLGWRDVLASKVLTQRQYTYAQSWADNGVYTPCVVVDGKATRAWRSGATPEPAAGGGGMLKLEEDGPHTWGIRFTPPATGGTWNASVALLGFGVQHAVRAGENRGRTLHHEFATIAYGSASLHAEGEDWSGSVDLAEPSMTATRYGIAAWVTREDDPTPVQAVGGFLPSP